MILRWMVVFVLAGASWLASPVLAHDGHDHKIMGTISGVAADRLDVNTTDGKAVSIVLTPDTKVRRGKASVSIQDLKAGERVVVNVGSGKEPMTAKEVLVGPTT